MGACTSCKCAKPRPKYKQVVRKIYQTGDPKKRYRDLLKYADFAPKKLPDMTRYLNKQLRQDVQYNEPDRVEVAIDAYIQILNKQSEHLNLYATNLIIMAKELLVHRNASYNVMGFKLVETFMPYAKRRFDDLSMLDSLIKCVCDSLNSTNDDLETERVLKFKESGLQAMACIIRNHGDTERLLKFHHNDIIPAVFGCVQVMDRPPSLESTEDIPPDFPVTSPALPPVPASPSNRMTSRISAEARDGDQTFAEVTDTCIDEICKIVSLGSFPLLLTPLLDHLTKQEWNDEVCLNCLRRCIHGMERNHEEIGPDYTITYIMRYLSKPYKLGKELSLEKQENMVKLVKLLLEEMKQKSFPSEVTLEVVKLISKVMKKYDSAETILDYLEECISILCDNAEFKVTGTTLEALFSQLKSSEKDSAKERFLHLAVEVSKIRGSWNDANVNIRRVLDAILGTMEQSTDDQSRQKCLECLKQILSSPDKRKSIRRESFEKDDSLQTSIFAGWIEGKERVDFRNFNLLNIEMRLLVYTVLLHALTAGKVDVDMLLEYYDIFYVLFCTHPDFDVQNQIPFLEHLQDSVIESNLEIEQCVCIHTLILASLKSACGALEDCKELNSYLKSIQTSRSDDNQGCNAFEISEFGLLRIDHEKLEHAEWTETTYFIDFQKVYDLLPSEEEFELRWNVNNCTAMYERWHNKLAQAGDMESDNEPDYLDGRTQSVYGTDSSWDLGLDENPPCPPLPCKVECDEYESAVDACAAQVSFNYDRIMDIMSELNSGSKVYINPDGMPMPSNTPTSMEHRERRGSRESVIPSVFPDTRPRKSTMNINAIDRTVETIQPRTFLYNIPCDPDPILLDSWKDDTKLDVPLLESVLDVDHEMSRILGLEHFDVTIECKEEYDLGPMDVEEDDLLETLENSFDRPLGAFPSSRMEDSHSYINLGAKETAKQTWGVLKGVAQKAKHQGGKLVKNIFKQEEKPEKEKKALITNMKEEISFRSVSDEEVHVGEITALQPSMV